LDHGLGFSRSLFPKGWRFDTQVIAMVLSTDRETPTDVLAMTGASAARHLSSSWSIRRSPSARHRSWT
jgi:polyribonucleotide nucleotidyltransferase